MTLSSQGSMPEWLWSRAEVSRPGRRKEPSSSEADDVSVVKITMTSLMKGWEEGKDLPLSPGLTHSSTLHTK